MTGWLIIYTAFHLFLVSPLALSEERVIFQQELRDYKLVEIPGDQPGLLSKNFQIIRFTDDNKYLIIDSVQTPQIRACDTNCFFYETVDEKFEYLVSLRIANKNVRDTLLKIPVDDSLNWLKYLSRHFYGSIKESVIVLKKGDRWTAQIRDLEIIKILPQNKWRLLRKLRDIGSCEISMDFTQILMCSNESTLIGNDLLPQGTLLLYDIPLDSLRILRDLGTAIRFSLRWDRNSPIICEKVMDSVGNIWSFLPGQDPKQLTFFKYPLTVGDILQMTKDSLKFWIRDFSNYRDWYSGVRKIKIPSF